MSTVLQVESVSKKFEIQRNRPMTLKESIIRRLNGKREPVSTIWALRDVSFSIEHGDALGIIGHNGAGKSTLLRLLCGLGRPTSGTIHRIGRVSGLLELGAGFHPDLTGRENIMTGGLLNGLTKQGVLTREDEIISFSELEEFIDQPVRTYSTGMYLRLAFSTAMNFDPDVLIIDEVLAVGDTSFQKKCFEKLSSFRNEGKTLIVTSHDINQIQRLCDEVLVLEDGKLVTQCEPDLAIPFYNDLMRKRTERRSAQLYGDDEKPNLTTEKGVRMGTQEATISSFQVYDVNGKSTNHLHSGESLTIEIKYKLLKPVTDMALMLGIYNDIHVKCFETHFPSIVDAFGQLDERCTIFCRLPNLPLIEGHYYLNVGLYPTNWEHVYDYHWQMHPFYITSGDQKNMSNVTGVISIAPEWSVRNSE
ncbi:MAG: ABC transporter ATP-binding protein [Thermodesulfobacteriota bacterium]